MDLAAFEALFTPAGEAALRAAQSLQPTEETFLTSLSRLKEFPKDLATAALETAILRVKARSKFPKADRMYFTREALEQASGALIADYRAQRFQPFATAADLGCGLGGDTLGLAGYCVVAAVDNDLLRLAIAARNAHVYGCSDRITFIHADLSVMQLPTVDAFWFDPARRAAGRRQFSVRGYQPPLTIVHQWLEHTPAVGVKISPGVDLTELEEVLGGRTPASYETEFISVDGELKECALRFGPFRTAARRATLLPGRHTLLPDPAAPSELSEPLAYLYEPDPAILRAGAVTALAAQLGARQLDPDIAYLTADSLRPTPFARAFAIADAFPFQLKRLRAYLRQRGVGQVTVKKRGSPLEPEELIRKLRLKGSESRIVFLTHVQGKAWALVGRPAS